LMGTVLWYEKQEAKTDPEWSQWLGEKGMI